MNRTEFEAVSALPETGPTLSAAELDGPDRTLAYGYTNANDNWHCYLADGALHVAIYDYGDGLVRYMTGTSLPVADLAPDKRVYPHRCDAQFARLMLTRGRRLPYTTFSDEAYEHTSNDRFHGMLVAGHPDYTHLVAPGRQLG
ncbi:hypothetical protein [Terracoccus luteus]|uniref:Uncharacterized protein n=1 Tax=Terracoccus luteus TaxID=53356 RepID=A0A839PYF0_9MICO|nr:hypothetical protein [Terracoccus luteus]MBB2988449.1 hypothetical protein [Terracoccus luteus]MCP2174096.1 hypothetical protein [Terracoccus luteus]